ncbi:NADP-dependent phosphogluconate dehydrogenase [Candidatus Schneideria nysicola]|uniref:NADP-dependent phosphogluconate dehydrogenase n=1 Tax=Candidatus Schneideria nysicola TaxID=1081631 RepID=UPI001CAA6041|nr:NADP-dependent phosphogluconate dehydrogenase [Candidatus Schneideria nysicola]UAJ65005.1 NADP-dependent phosphogluconate dehydrogenase [Candidatus Schneideria nysicola]
MLTQQIGVIGMATMGRNLALNIENCGYSVSIFNRNPEKTNLIIANNQCNKIVPYYSIKEFVLSLKKPRIIILMIKAGTSIDNMINLLRSYLDKGDILIDGGNSFYKDTIRRNIELSKAGINFIGAGISGGEEGALKGPSIMPGGQKHAYEIVSPMLKKIAAHIENEACVTYIGPDGSGHYVKMVHNGIEYGDMQLISEAYFLLKNILSLHNEELYQIFNKWNEGELKSYLIEITGIIFKKKDQNGNYLIDYILDTAENKGTGKWTSQSALDLNEPLTLITSSVFARYISFLKKERVYASKLLFGPEKIKVSNRDNKELLIEKIRRALYLGKIISYSQGFSQLKSASIANNWNLNYSEIAKIFRAGCIIRADLLKNIYDAYREDNNLTNLLVTSYFSNIVNLYQQDLRDIVILATQHGIPIPALYSAMAYYDSYRSAQLPANLIQAQRDYFGAHTYQRIDKKGNFHTNWLVV